MTVTIADTGTQSGQFLPYGRLIAGVTPDSAFDDADISIEVAQSPAPGETLTWLPALDYGGNAIKFTAARANKFSALDRDAARCLLPFELVRLVSSVAQSGATVIDIRTL